MAYEFTPAPYEGYKAKIGPTTFKTVVGNISISTKAAQRAASVLRTGGAVLGFVGLGMTGIEIAKGQKNLLGEGGLDLIMGGAAFFGPAGWVVSGIYFGGKFAFEATGNKFW